MSARAVSHAKTKGGKTLSWTIPPTKRAKRAAKWLGLDLLG